LNRRDFLKVSGLGIGAGMAITFAKPLVKEAHAAAAPPQLEQRKTICNKCAVGCGIIGEVKDGVWVSQEPHFDHPISTGSLCSKGAAAREDVIGEKRLKYPMKKVNGKWRRISWDQALSEISGKLLDIRKRSGPDSVFWFGSAKFSNEGAYMHRKFCAFWGTNNTDHQARICHSTTVAGLANVWGYGAMTNSMNDIRNSNLIFCIGENICESHPIAMHHVLTAKEQNDAPFIVVDPRFTKTAAKSTEYVRIRPGTDIAFVMGLIHIILKNGWEDKAMLRDRTNGFEEHFRPEAKKYPPELVSDITGIPVAQIERVARLLAEHRPGTVIWAMGGTQHHNGNVFTRSYCMLQLVLGNMGKNGGGANVFRGHDNVQGATDLGVLSNTLPGYYGLSDGAWKHWSRVWGVSHDYMKSRHNPKLMNKKGFTVARWYEGVLMDPKDLGQPKNLEAVVYWGHAPNSQSQMGRVKQALKKVGLVVVIDLHPTLVAGLADREDNMYLLPAASQYEQSGCVTNSNRHFQWREKVVDPIFEAKTDTEILIEFSKRFGFHKEYTKNIKEIPEDITREFLRGLLTIGYTGQTPERMKRQQANMHTFDARFLKAEGGPCDGEYYGLPWPCWTPEHPGTPILYDVSKSVAKGGLPFRARWGTKAPDGSSLLAGKDSAPVGSQVRGGYPEFKDVVKGTNWKTDLSLKTARHAISRGMAPFGNGRARMNVWNLPDPVTRHREPLATPRPDLLDRYGTYDDVKDHYRVLTLFKSNQNPDTVKSFPLILTSGRQVEHEGGGDQTRSAKWLVELQPEMYAEIHPRTANDYGVRKGEFIWVEGPYNNSRIKVKAKVTRRVGPGVIFLPYHWGGEFQGESLVANYPEGLAPYGIGESANTVTNYGYDRVTQMQETKAGLCRIKKA
jgi:formate dehydrogenase major subunit